MFSTEEGIAILRTATTREDVAEALGMEFKNLIYYLYAAPDEQRYKTFAIAKRNGSQRCISAPLRGLKLAQQRLARILQQLYRPAPCVHAYLPKRSIITNARPHTRKQVVVNLDLENFFGSIHFGRVYGMFQHPPFNYPKEVATVLAKICCHDNQLPQGAPTSPVIANLICRRMDHELMALCKGARVSYTRYADDLTFSTNLKCLPEVIGTIIKGTPEIKGQFVPSIPLQQVIENNDFRINPTKSRYALPENRQTVTGIVTNDGINIDRRFIRRTRAMLHAWEKFGRQAAAAEHYKKYALPKPGNPEENFQNEVIGRIQYIRHIRQGRQDSVAQSLIQRLRQLNTRLLFLPDQVKDNSNRPIVFCEGKTDGEHLQMALRHFQAQGEFSNLDVVFHKYGNTDINNTSLYELCSKANRIKYNDRTEIYLFDSDDHRYGKKELCDEGLWYKKWSDHIYSVLLPTPAHRCEMKGICIEFLYEDKILYAKDSQGRRLYTSDEFDERGELKDDHNIYYAGRASTLKGPKRIIECNVHHRPGDESMALSKVYFAKAIRQRKGNFSEVNFEHFRPILKILSDILIPL